MSDSDTPPLLSTAKRELNELSVRVKQRFDLFDPLLLLPFLSHGTRERGWLRGRLVEEEAVTDPTDSSVWENVLNTLSRVSSDEIPHARIRARIGARTWEAETDHQGFFEFELDGPFEPGWREVELEVVDSVAGSGESATGRFLVPSPDAEFGIISDVNDTVIHTRASDRMTMLGILLLKNARTRMPFPGVAALYRALQRGPDGAGHNPIFYLSRTEWNLYDLFERFLQLHEIPEGPLFLRDVSLTEKRSPVLGRDQDKLDRIHTLLDTYPDLSFVLVGDTGQRDPEIYLEVAKQRPGRIRAVYLRHMAPPERDEEVWRIYEEIRALGIPVLRARSTENVAEHAAEHNLIPRSAVEEVRAGRARDEEEG